MNYLTFEGLFSNTYMYADLVDEYLADSLLYRHKIPVKFKCEHIRSGDKYRLITCNIRKKYVKAFMEAMEELKTKMCLLGHNDYEDWCSHLLGLLEEDIEKATSGGNKHGQESAGSRRLGAV